MLDLVRLSRRLLFPPGGEDLYRQIALLSEMGPGLEVLASGCGLGVPLEYFVQEYGVHGSGVDFDWRVVEAATYRIRDAGLSDRLQFQTAPLDRLPYRDRIFDVSVGELGLTARADPARAVRELVRVTKPGGTIFLVQMVWKAAVDRERRELLSEHLGVRPLMLVEWKRILREAGVRQIHTEDWSDEETAFRPTVTKPFPDFAELVSLPEKLGILRRAWKWWGWRGVRTAVIREREVHRLLTKERILGLDLLKGIRTTDEGASGEEPSRRDGKRGRDRDGEADGGRPERDAEPDADTEPETEADTEGLPLFSSGEGRR